MYLKFVRGGPKLLSTSCGRRPAPVHGSSIRLACPNARLLTPLVTRLSMTVAAISER